MNIQTALKAVNISNVMTGERCKLPLVEGTDKVILASGFEDSDHFLDYYGEFRGGYPWISSTLEIAAEKAGGYWEWENPEAIVFVKN